VILLTIFSFMVLEVAFFMLRNVYCHYLEITAHVADVVSSESETRNEIQ
jgi:hypothetical protein